MCCFGPDGDGDLETSEGSQKGKDLAEKTLGYQASPAQMRSLLLTTKPAPLEAPRAQDSLSLLRWICNPPTPVLTPSNGELEQAQGRFCQLPYFILYPRVKPKASKGNRRTRGRIRTQGRLSKPRLVLFSSGHLYMSGCLSGPGWRRSFCTRSRGKMGALSRHAQRGTRVQAAR